MRFLLLKSTVCIVLTFVFAIFTYYIYSFYRMDLYVKQLKSSSVRLQNEAFKELLTYGDKGQDSIRKHFGDGKEAANLLIETWPKLDKPVVNNEHKLTALHLSAKNNYTQSCEMILESGVDPNLKVIDVMQTEQVPNELGVELIGEYDSYAALHFASLFGNEKIAQIMIKHKCNLDSRDRSGVTPLHLAAQHGHLDIVRLLINSGAVKSPQCEYTWHIYDTTPLHMAAGNGHYEIINYMISRHVPVNEQDHDGTTALHLAVRNGHKKVAGLLLKNGANLNIVGRNGTPIDEAHASGHKEIAEILVDRDGENTRAK